jgi:hypothetical protein
MGDLREGVSPVVHRVLDKADKLRVSMARLDADAVWHEFRLEQDGMGLNTDDFLRMAALLIIYCERAAAEVKP